MKTHFFIYIIKECEGFHLRINYDDLLYVQALGDYVNIQTKTQRYTTHQTLGEMTEKHKCLYRNHRSYSVNIDNIDIVTKNDIRIGKYEIPMGEQYKKELLILLYQN